MATASGRQFLEAKRNSVLVTPLSTSFSILLARINVERGVSIFPSHVIITPMTLECHNPTEQHGPKGKHKEIAERRELSVNPGFICYCIFETFFFKFMKRWQMVCGTSREVAWPAQCQSWGRPAPGLPVLHAVGYTSVNPPDPKAGYQALTFHKQNLVDQT